MAFWPSSKLNITRAQTADVTEDSSTDPVDIPGLGIYLPRAGTYHILSVLPWSSGDATSRTMGIGLSYSGTTTSMSGSVPAGTGGAQVTGFLSQTTMGTLGTASSITITAGRLHFHAVVVVSTAGTLKMQFSRSAASITHTSGVMTVREA